MAQKARGQLTIAVINDGEQGGIGPKGSDGWTFRLSPSVLALDDGDLVESTSGTHPFTVSSGKGVVAIEVYHGETKLTPTVSVTSRTNLTTSAVSKSGITVGTISSTSVTTAVGVKYLPVGTASAIVSVTAKDGDETQTRTLTLQVTCTYSTKIKSLISTDDEFTSTIGEISQTVEGIETEVSEISQKADEISMTVSAGLQTDNLLTGTQFRRVLDGWSWMSTANACQIRRAVPFGGRGSLYAKCASGVYVGAHWGGLNLQSGKKYVLAFYYRVEAADYSSSFIVGVTLRASDGTIIKAKQATLSAGTDGWQYATVVTDTLSSAYADATFDLYAYGAEGAAYLSSPFLGVGESFAGWSASANDADYIGGNLLDNTDTLKTGGNLVAASNPATTESDGVATVHATAAASGTATLLRFRRSVGAATEYTLSFWAKRTAGTGGVVVNFSTNVAYCETSEGTVSRYSSDAGNTTASGYVSLTATSEWQRVWVHFRTTAASTTQNIYIQASNGATIYAKKPKLEVGALATGWTTYGETTEGDLYSQLLPTGIDIRNRRIEVTTDQFVVKNNAGETTAEIDKNGNLTVHNGLFTGFQMMAETLITPDNIDGLLSVDNAANGYISLDFASVGSNPVFSGALKAWATAKGMGGNYPTVILPSNSTSMLAACRVAASEAVPYIGARMVIRNTSDTTIGVYGGGTILGGSGVSTSWIENGYMAILECKMVYSSASSYVIRWDGWNVKYLDGTSTASETDEGTEEGTEETTDGETEETEQQKE